MASILTVQALVAEALKNWLQRAEAAQMGSIVLVLLLYSGLLAQLHSKEVCIYALGMRGAVNTASRTSKLFFVGKQLPG